MIVLLLSAALMGPPAPHRAPAPYRPDEPRTTKAGCVLLVTTAAADVASTELQLSRGFVEANPLGQDRTVRLATKLGVTAGLCALDQRLRRDGHGKAAWWLTGTVSAIWAGMAAWNLTR